jgi:hypothetical protein
MFEFKGQSDYKTIDSKHSLGHAFSQLNIDFILREIWGMKGQCHKGFHWNIA